ncbi:hypothetical protein NKG94_07330 [Micromonospora sp. M12]
MGQFLDHRVPVQGAHTRSTLSTQLFDLRSRSASICCVIDRRTRHRATRRPIGRSSLLTPPPPVRDRTGRVLHRYALRLRLSEEALFGSLPLGRLHLLALAL